MGMTVTEIKAGVHRLTADEGYMLCDRLTDNTYSEAFVKQGGEQRFYVKEAL